LPECDLSSTSGTASEQLHTIISRLLELDPQIYQRLTQQATNIAEQYSKDIRLDKIAEYTGRSSRNILMVTDYIDALGGIETYIDDAAMLLSSQ